MTQSEIAINAGIKKANLSTFKQFILGIMAGAFIAFGAEAANMISYNIASVNTAKFLAGLIFPAGLIMVVIAGAELFTGNCLMIFALAEKKITLKNLLRSWVVVYLGNFVGGILIAGLIYFSGQLNYDGGLLGAYTIKAAASKTAMNFLPAFVMGVLCNWLVCLAVYMSYGADSTVGKAAVIFFPIWLFVASGFEHSIANMYYITAGIFSKSNGLYLSKAIELGADVNNLNWLNMLVKNLLPVTLGNILGGAGFVGLAYWKVNR